MSWLFMSPSPSPSPIQGIIVFAILGALVFAAMNWWQNTTPTWRQITRIAAPFLLQLALVIYGAFLAGLLGALHRTHGANSK